MVQDYSKTLQQKHDLKKKFYKKKLYGFNLMDFCQPPLYGSGQ